jgi:hypothetical protein
MARTEKVSITIDAAVLAAVKKRARAARKNLSTFISDELADALRRQGLKALIQDFERESGPITAAERRKARALLEAADRPRKRRTTAA